MVVHKIERLVGRKERLLRNGLNTIVFALCVDRAEITTDRTFDEHLRMDFFREDGSLRDGPEFDFSRNTLADIHEEGYFIGDIVGIEVIELRGNFFTAQKDRQPGTLLYRTFGKATGQSLQSASGLLSTI